jgi:hypothetical protein
MVSPKPGQPQAIFQQDSQVCQQHSMTHTGYGTPAPSSPQATPPATPTATGVVSQDASFLQCMAARGDTVTALPPSYAAVYPGYPYAYGFDPYPLYVGGFFGGYYGHRGWHHGGYRGGGFHGGRAGSHR